LARALYGKPPLVILDEPNASLDSEGEAALMEAIEALKRARSTVVVISHKTAMLAVVDKLLVLEAGRVSAFGGRNEVVSRLMGGPKIAAVASGATAVRYLSAETGRSIGKNNESSRITNLHRYAMQGVAGAAPETAAAVGAQAARTQANRRSQARLGFAMSTVAAAAFIGVYFHVEVAAFLTGYYFRELASQELRKPDSVALWPQAEVEQVNAQVATQDAAQITQAVEASALEARQPLKNVQRSEASANELAARAAALASEPTGTGREIETQTAQSQKAVDEATKQKQAAESTIAQLQQSLQQAQKETTALMQVAKATQATAADAKPPRALDEAQGRAALASELAGTGSEIETAQSQMPADDTKQKQAADSTIAQLQPSLQQDQKKTTALMQEAKAAQAAAADAEPQRRAFNETEARAAALASEPTGIGPEIETQTAQSLKAVDAATKQEQAADSHIVNLTQAVKTAVTESPEAAEAQGNAEAAKLIARASALLGQGDIGAARIVLERASETGSAKASFMLAETYDPAILTAWGTYGTRSEVTKARELYAKAHAGGIQEAKNRFDALHQ
jgi:ABC-type glutathione transport system ATPase component